MATKTSSVFFNLLSAGTFEHLPSPVRVRYAYPSVHIVTQIIIFACVAHLQRFLVPLRSFLEERVLDRLIPSHDRGPDHDHDHDE